MKAIDCFSVNSKKAVGCFWYFAIEMGA